MRNLIIIFALILLFCATGLAIAEDKVTVFKCNFDEPNVTETWTDAKERITEGYKSPHSLLIENENAYRTITCSTQIPADRIEGRLITVSAVVKADNISQPTNHWNGIKVMLILETKEGKQHSQLPLGAGSFQWTPMEQIVRVPKGIKRARLVLGLEKSSGRAWFDDIRVSIGRAKKGKRFDTKFKGHDLPRLRGVVHGPLFNEKNIRILAEQWKSNQVRWQLNPGPMKKNEVWAKDLDAYDKWLDGALDSSDRALAACEKYGLMVVVDLHCPPGGLSDDGVCLMFSNKQYQDKLVEVWGKIARRYKERKCVYAYDLINEPVEPKAGGTITWPELAIKVIDTIRAIDPGKPVVFEPGPWGNPEGFDQIVPLDRDGVIYSFHMYKPHILTHQGVHEQRTGVKYPGVIDRLMWNKDRLEEAMIAAIDFQNEFNVQIYVGEFSAIRWAPDNSAYRYLHDCIDLFEKYGWDWSYHAFREWHGWSVEHGCDKGDVSPSIQQTDRERLLRSWFAKNKRP
jgi:endoglucanase